MLWCECCTLASSKIATLEGADFTSTILIFGAKLAPNLMRICPK